MKNIYIVIFILTNISILNVAYAIESRVGKIWWVMAEPSIPQIRFRMSVAHNCGGNTWFKFDSTDVNGNATLSTILMAKAADRDVDARYHCVTTGDVDAILDYVIVK